MNKVSMTGLIDYGRNGAQIDESKKGLMRFTLRVRKPKNQVKEGSNEIYEFIDCVSFGKTSENIKKFFNDKDVITVHGALSTYKRKAKVANQNGEEKEVNLTITNVTVMQFDFIPGNNNSGGGSNNNSGGNTQSNNGGNDNPWSGNDNNQSSGGSIVADDSLPF